MPLLPIFNSFFYSKISTHSFFSLHFSDHLIYYAISWTFSAFREAISAFPQSIAWTFVFLDSAILFHLPILLRSFSIYCRKYLKYFTINFWTWNISFLIVWTFPQIIFSAFLSFPLIFFSNVPTISCDQSWTELITAIIGNISQLQKWSFINTISICLTLFGN